MKSCVTKIYNKFEKIRYRREHDEICILNVMGKIKPVILSEEFGIKIRNLTDQEIKTFISYKNPKTVLEFKTNGIDDYFDVIHEVESDIYDEPDIEEYLKLNKVELEEDTKDLKQIEIVNLYLFCKDIIILEYNKEKIITAYQEHEINVFKSQLDSEEDIIIETFIEGIMKIIFVLLSGSSTEDHIDYLDAVRYKLDSYNLILLLRRFNCEFLQDFSIFNERKHELENVKYLLDNHERNLFNEYIFITNTLESGLLNDKLTLLSYITVLEFLLTAKPDDSSYDESINRQFIKNTMICISLIRNNMSRTEFKELKKELREIYDYRSNIVHGNFDKLCVNLNKIKKFEFYQTQDYDVSGMEDYLIIIRLSQILKIVFKAWINYPLLFEIFKNR